MGFSKQRRDHFAASFPGLPWLQFATIVCCFIQCEQSKVEAGKVWYKWHSSTRNSSNYATTLLAADIPCCWASLVEWQFLGQSETKTSDTFTHHQRNSSPDIKRRAQSCFQIYFKLPFFHQCRLDLQRVYPGPCLHSLLLWSLQTQNPCKADRQKATLNRWRRSVWRKNIGRVVL